jgi:hypothetical protein
VGQLSRESSGSVELLEEDIIVNINRIHYGKKDMVLGKGRRKDVAIH